MRCLSEGGERETSTRPGCRWFQRPLSLGRESTEPWQTPLLTVKEGEVALPRRTYEWTLVYQCLMRRQVFPVMPAFLK